MGLRTFREIIMQSANSQFEIVKDVTEQLRFGGSCALCGFDYTATNGKRVLARYYQESSAGYPEPITEPFNLCADCFNKHN
jgi:hypothetical protein